MDLQYHDIRPHKGCIPARQHDMVDRITSDDLIERAKHVPPQTTRARCARVHPAGQPQGKDYRVDWVYLSSMTRSARPSSANPFQSHDERVERLIRSF